MNLTSLLFMSCLLSNVLGKRPENPDEKSITPFIPLFSDFALSDKDITVEFVKLVKNFYKGKLPMDGVFFDTFSPLFETELADYLNAAVPKSLHTKEGIQNDMDTNIKMIGEMITQVNKDQIKSAFITYLNKSIPNYLMGYINSKTPTIEVANDAFDRFEKLVFEKLNKMSAIDPKVTQAVEEMKDNFNDYMINLRAYLKNKYQLFSKLHQLFDKIVDNVESGAAPLTGDSFMALNERAFEFARAIMLASKTRNEPLAPHLLQLLNKLAKSPKRFDKDEQYPKWNALLARRILQLLAENNELEPARQAMKGYLAVGEPSSLETAHNYAVLLDKIYRQTNPVFAFDGNNLSTQKRKLFAIDMILNSSPKHDSKSGLTIEQQDLEKIINEFEKMVDVPVEALKASSINPQYTKMPADYEEALNNPSFLVMQNDLMNALNAFKLGAKPQELADDQFPGAFDRYLDEKLADPSANLDKNYPMLKLINAKQFLAPTDAQIQMKPLSSQAAENLKERIDEPAYEPIKSGLLSLYAADKPIYQKNVDNKDYLQVPEAFPAANLIKEFQILPNPTENQDVVPENKSPSTYANKGSEGKQKKRDLGSSQDRNRVNVVIGYLPPEVREFLETTDTIYEKLADENTKFSQDYLFAKVKRITSACP